MSDVVIVALIAGIAAFAGGGLSTLVGWINNQNNVDASAASLDQSEHGQNERLERKLSAELEKLSSKLDKQYELRWRTDWQRLLHESLSEFIVKTDPEYLTQQTDYKEIVSLLHKTTILLNNSGIESHGKLNHEVIQMGLYINNWLGDNFDLHTALRYHNSLIDAAKEVLYLPAQ